MRTLTRYLRNEQSIILVLTLTALICLPIALSTTAPDAALTLLVPVTLIGTAGGFLVQHPRLASTRASTVFLGLGALALFVRVGQLWQALDASLWQTVRILWLVILPSQQLAGHAEDLFTWLAAMDHSFAAVAVCAQRIVFWLASTFSGRPADDAAARALVLGLLLWLLSGWASWRVRAKNDAVGALLPVTFCLALTLSRIHQDRWPVWLHIAAFLLLLVAVNLSRLTASWKARHTDFSDSIGEDSVLNAILVIMVVMSAAFAASEFSLRDLRDRLREFQRPAASTVSSTAGSAPAAGRSVSGPNATLEGVHVISGGPAPSDEIVMYIRTGDTRAATPAVPSRAAHYYWRGVTYQNYTGRGWNNSAALSVEAPAHTELGSPASPGYRSLHATVIAPAGVQGGLYWAGILVDVDQPVTVLRRGGSDSTDRPDMIGALIADDQAGSVRTYAFDALLPEADESALRAAPPGYPEWVRQQYLQLPEIVPERVRALARDITAPGQTAYDRALAIETYLRSIPYSADVPGPPSGREATDYFLFDLKRGYCDYYATAMAVMARSAGLPARVVVGYAGGAYDSRSARYVVTKGAAHSWTEIYFPGFGWIEFEPTAGQPAPAREGTRLQPEPARIPAIGNPAWRLSFSLPTTFPRFAVWLLAALAALGLAWLEAEHLRLTLMSPGEAAGQVFRRMRHLTRRLGGLPVVGQTAREYTAVVIEQLGMLAGSSRLLNAIAGPASASLVEITHLYMLSLFAPLPLGPSERRRAIRAWRSVRWRLDILDLILAIRHRSTQPRGIPSSLRASRAG